MDRRHILLSKPTLPEPTVRLLVSFERMHLECYQESEGRDLPTLPEPTVRLLVSFERMHLECYQESEGRDHPPTSVILVQRPEHGLQSQPRQKLKLMGHLLLL